MSVIVKIQTQNYSGKTANITFFPDIGGTIDVGSHVVPYDYYAEYYYGNFELYFPEYGDTCFFTVPNPVTPTTTTTTTNDILTEVSFALGRQFAPDIRDRNYLIKDKLNVKPTAVTIRYWGDNEWWGDQGNAPQCVGYAWAHWIEDGPVTHGGIAPIVHPTLIYREAQKIDEWPGENYNGTSVRAGAKYLQKSGKIKSYLWAYDLNTLINTVLNVGPVVVGTYWYLRMFYPDKNGLIKIEGPIVGGHAYVINGVDTTKKLFRIKNSWGKKWGSNGSAYISFADMELLIKLNGEICLATENKF
jgi:hypothetical protein